jgi:hypothetical protein
VCLSLWWHKQKRGVQFNATLYRREGCKVNTNIKEEGEVEGRAIATATATAKQRGQPMC